MDSVVPLRSRDARWEIPLLALAIVLGSAVAALALAVVFGIGTEPEPRWTPSLLAIAVLAFGPAAWCARRWVILRRPAEVVVGESELVISYPELLRSPLVVPRSSMRLATAPGDVAWPLPALVPAGVKPNLMLLFEGPVEGARVRRSRFGGIYRGEHVAGLLLAADDDRALAPFMRPL